MNVAPDAPALPIAAVQPAYVPLTPWQPLWALGLTCGIVAASIVLPTVLLGYYVSGAADKNFETGSPVFFAVMLLSQLVMGGGAWWLAGLKGGLRRDVLALRAVRGGWRTYALAILAMLAATTAFNLFRLYVLNHDIYADLKLLAPMFRQPLWPLSFLIVVVGAPLAEEWLFRGYLQSALAGSRIGFVGAAIVATLIWTALHAYSIPGMVLVGLLGALFSWMLWWGGSLRVPIAAHAANNAIACLYLQFGPPLG
jgi:uncharacterized protein